MIEKLILLLLIFWFCVPVAMAGEVGFIERYSLSENRSDILKQLIPGTEDHYFYSCLTEQNSGNLSQARALIEQWIKTHGLTSQAREMQYRQVLLEYPNRPDDSLSFLKNELNLRFDHQRRQQTPKTSYPSELDQALISRQSLTRQAFSLYSNLDGFEITAWPFLARESLDKNKRRHFLSRLQRPDLPGLVEMIVADLQTDDNGGFGYLPIHAQLLPEQLEQCLSRLPELSDDTNFIQAWLSKLQPSPDQDWKNDPQIRRKHLERLWNFAGRLSPNQNSLKVHVLYQQLVLDRQLGTYDVKKFQEYLKLPRSAGYVNREYLSRKEHRDHQANLYQDFGRFTLFPPVADDEPLVRDYLETFLKDAETPNEYAPYFDKDYLKRVFAETKLQEGTGKAENLLPLLTPEGVKSLKEQILLEFLPSNPQVVGMSDPISLKVRVKNIPNLIVKVFRINTFNYYRQQQQEISTGIDLDGLVANEEKVYNYTHPEIRRHTETFEFQTLTEPGLYVIELIGNGRSSRALIRRGRLTFTERSGSAGQVFTVYDETGKPVKDASIWMAGHEFTPDERGRINIPFSTSPGTQSIIIRRGEVAVLHQMMHQAENYSLQARLFVDRESLLERRQANLVVRPWLTVNGTPIDIALLEEVRLRIDSTDRDGISATKEIPAPQLQNATETLIPFKVPEKLSRISFTLRGKVQSLSQNKKIDLEVSQGYTLNGIEKTDKIDDLHLRLIDGRYVLELRGKTGEPKPDRVVTVEIKHRDFVRPVKLSLQTNDLGRIFLGRLADISWVAVEGLQGVRERWELLRDRASLPSVLHARVGETLHLPMPYAADTAPADLFSLLEVRGNTFVKNCAEFGKVQNGQLSITGLTGGDYHLFIVPEQKTIRLRITEGQLNEGWAQSPARTLEMRTQTPLALDAPIVDAAHGKLLVKVYNPNAATRVHLVATRHIPDVSLFDGLQMFMRPDPREFKLNPSVSQYVSGRNIGEEYQYILDRKYAKVRVGNLLRQPSLLLNPWNLRKTDTTRQDAAGGESWTNMPVPAPSMEAGTGGFGGDAPNEPEPVEAGGFACLDFLPTTSLLIANLRPNTQGLIEVDLSALEGRQHVQILAVDQYSAIYRQLSLPETPYVPKDLTIAQPLEPSKHFTEQKSISTVASGSEFALDDITTAKLEMYDSLQSVYGLFSTLSANPTLAEFSFILEWPELSAARKGELYSKYACHELSFFLYHKDPQFFKTVIKPYLASKRDRTFMDDWLLENDLSGYLTPWRYGRLNVVERILLARRLPKEFDTTARHIRDRFDLLPPDLERWNQLFDTALKGNAMDTDDRLGFDKAQAAAPAKPRPMAPPPPPAPGSMGPMGRVAPSIVAPRMASKGARSSTEDVKMKKDSRRLEKASLEETAAPEVADMEMDDVASIDEFKEQEADRGRRQVQRQLYQALDRTEEWVENNYYRLPIEKQVADLITVNAFWSDFAAHKAGTPFLSKNVAAASRNFSEMMLALAVIDLPFKAGSHNITYTDARMSLKAVQPAIFFHKEIRETGAAGKVQEILTGQNFFAADDRYRYENSERLDQFVTEEFQTWRVYGCQVIITNPSSTRRKIDALLQIPQGSVPVNNGFYTRSINLQLEPYTTKTVEYYFYFPKAGRYTHFPIHISQEARLLASAEPFVFQVVDQLTKVDKTSWTWISQEGSPEDVLSFLETNNADRLDLNLIAFRLRDRAFFAKVVDLLQKRHIYHDTTWSYGVLHNDPAVIREYLAHLSWANQCGLFIDTPLLSLNPVWRHAYQHREYWPMVNARAHQLGKDRKILNRQFHEQYVLFLRYLAYRPKLDDGDRLGIVYYLLLQDRIDEALSWFNTVKSPEVCASIQYDYLKAWLAFSEERAADGLAIAERYREYPVDRWRKLFQEMLQQADEIAGKGPVVVDQEDRNQVQAHLAATEPNLELKIENGKLQVLYQNLKSCRINFYQMDLELLFSRNPFVQGVSNQFSVIRPNQSLDLSFDTASGSREVEIPEAIRDRNLMIELTNGSVTRTQPYYPNKLGVQVQENYGQLRVTKAGTGTPLPRVYVKVYAQLNDGQVIFYKDGYTDLRGRFDYTSLSTSELDQTQKFSLLIVSDQFGAVVREAAPPKR